MASTFATTVAGIGLIVASGALIMLLNSSALVGGSTNFVMLVGWVVVFFVGIFLFGWGLGRRIGP